MSLTHTDYNEIIIFIFMTMNSPFSIWINMKKLMLLFVFSTKKYYKINYDVTDFMC